MDATNVGGTLTTAAQPNITSVGTLTSLNVSGTATAANAATSTELVTLGQLNSAMATVSSTAFPGWIDLVLTANSTSLAGHNTLSVTTDTYAAPSFYKDSSGVVHMRGGLSVSTSLPAGGFYIVAILPSGTGYLPTYGFYIPNFVGLPISNGAGYIAANGFIYAYAPTGSSGGDLNFDCVTFQTN